MKLGIVLEQFDYPIPNPFYKSLKNKNRRSLVIALIINSNNNFKVTYIINLSL